MSFEAASRMVVRYRDSGVVIDAGLLLLCVIGSYDRSLIGKFKRTSMFAESDFELLLVLLKSRPQLLTTPHILTEIDNFADSISSNVRDFRTWFHRFVLPELRERSPRSRDLASLPEFPRLGLADSSAIHLSKRRRLIITKDFDLYRTLDSKRLPVINFDHLRSEAYEWETDVAALFPERQCRS
jgi:hypothetical protein